MDTPRKRAGISLKLKLLAFTVVMLALVGWAGYYTFFRPTAELLQNTLLAKGAALCKNLAYNLRVDIIFGEEKELTEPVLGVLAEEEVLYVIVYDAEGKLMLHKAKSGGIGQAAMEADEEKLKKGAEDRPVELTAGATGERFFVISQPVERIESAEGTGAGTPGKPLGYVHLGIALSDIEEATDEFKRRLVWVTVVLGGVGIAAYLLLFGFLISPVTRMAGVADKIARGNLTERVNVSSSDEIGTLATSFNEMLLSLERMARELRDAGSKLSGSASDILTAAEEQSASSREQSVSVNETTATMEELAQTSKQIAENSDRVARTAEETFLTAQAGAKAVEDTIAGMMSIKAQTESNTNKIFALSDKVQKIGNVVKIINDIADQTKLIAFNAAIEAAGAGDAGKRFSIVAVEVRRLADTVVESIEEIKGTITEIQLATNELILSSEKGIKDVEEGVNVASRGGEALQKIIQMIKHTTESSKQISLSTQQQRTASEQVVISMKEVSKTANQTASSSKQTIAIATELNTLSEQLGDVVKRFDLGDGQPVAAPRRVRERDLRG